MLILILQREISRSYKVPLTAFTAFDPEGNNYVTANDLINSKWAYRLPFTKDELRYLLERETVFKRVPKLTIDLFIKYLFPDSLRAPGNNKDERSDSNESSGSNNTINTSTGGSAIKPKKDSTLYNETGTLTRNSTIS